VTAVDFVSHPFALTLMLYVPLGVDDETFRSMVVLCPAARLAGLNEVSVTPGGRDGTENEEIFCGVGLLPAEAVLMTYETFDPGGTVALAQLGLTEKLCGK
jgi:hypothetical protein